MFSLEDCASNPVSWFWTETSGPFDWMLVNAPALKSQFMSQSSEHDVMLCLQLLKPPFKRLTWQAGPLPKESCNGLPGALLPLSGLISGRSRFWLC
jgi:hypothetical protein